MADGTTHRIIEAGAADVDRVEGLWRGMVAHHEEVIGHAWTVREAGAAWILRRAQYRSWLEGDNAFMLIALSPEDGEALGYAVLSVHPSGPTFDLGDCVGDLESLAVAPGARGTGVGSALIEALPRDPPRSRRADLERLAGRRECWGPSPLRARGIQAVCADSDGPRRRRLILSAGAA